jgi:hypothetical protein
MKKILLCSFIFSGLLFANQLSYLPLDKKFLSEENGGDKPAIESYSDGVGIYTVGKFQIDNRAMNELVFKFGEEAKKNGVTLKEYVLDNGNNKEKDLAENLGSVAKNIIPSDGAECDDNNPKTENDIYINGICKGLEPIFLSYFILKDANWNSSSYKMLGFSFSVNNILINKNLTNFNALGVSSSSLSLFNEFIFGFTSHLNQVSPPLSNIHINPVKVSFFNPILITSPKDIVISYVAGAYYFPNQRINSFTIEFYSSSDKLIASKTFSNLEKGTLYNQGIYYCLEISYFCLNKVDSLNYQF